MDLLIKVLLAYLLGSVVGSLVIGHLRGGVDIRKLGSGNPGTTADLTAASIFVVLLSGGWKTSHGGRDAATR